MICKRISDGSVAVTAEEPDDLLTLRRVIDRDDRVVSDTTRVIKLDREYARPDSGQRVRIRIALDVERVGLDYRLDRLRIQGVIAESNNEAVPRRSHHSLVIKPNDSFTLTKRTWSGLHRALLKSSQGGAGFVLVAIDTGDCGIGRLKGTHLHTIPNIYSGYSGKRYKSSFKIEGFFDEVRVALASMVKKNDVVIIFGPGQTKNRLANHLQASRLGKGHRILVTEGVDSSGEDGLYTFTKSDSMREAISESKLARVSSIIDEIMTLASKKSARFAMGIEETKRAGRLGAVDSLVFSEKLLQETDEDAAIGLINEVQAQGAKTYSVDSSTDAGLRVDGLGGVVALLRFSVS